MAQNTGQYAELMTDIFYKKFSFTPNTGSFCLPPLKDIFSTDTWQDENLQRLKIDLNAVKSKLNHQKLEIWSQHTRQCNPAGEIVSKVRNGSVKGEFVTQAWCKLYEILANFPELCAANETVFKALHVCEAPGGFVAALNHYLTLNHPNAKFEWKATTLNPYWEGNALGNMIIDDRFILQTIDRWEFGGDYTGNIMHLENLNKIKEWANQSVRNFNFLLLN